MITIILLLCWITSTYVLFGFYVAYSSRTFYHVKYEKIEYVADLLIAATGPIVFLIVLSSDRKLLSSGWTVNPWRDAKIKEVEARLDRI